MAKKYKIGLALSGGGVLGAAHIGVLEEIEKSGVKIDYIAGVSAGSIIGGIYAAKGVKGLDDFYKELKSKKFFGGSNKLPIGGPTKIFSELEKILKNYIPESFLELNIPLAVIATNINSGEPNLINEGNPIETILASSAYPGVFPIQEISGESYIDGGVTTNLPAEQVREKCQFVIGSSIYSIPEIKPVNNKKISRGAILTRSLDIIEKQLSVYQENYCDFCFKPKTKSLRWFHFWKAEEIRELGRAYAREEINNLLKQIENKSILS